MIYFNNPDMDDKQFVEIEIANHHDIDVVISMLQKEIHSVDRLLSIDRTEPEILIEIPASGLPISLNNLKKNIGDLKITATVSIFSVDLSNDKQRLYSF